MSGESFFKYGYTIPVSRDMAIDFGLVEPTDAEQREREARIAEWRAKKRAALPRLQAGLDALAALDGIERQILDLHARAGSTCEGCDFSGWEGESPEWPCRTVDLIAERHGIDLRDFYLYDPETT